MYQRILVPVDGSPTSKKGLDEAIALARLTGGRIFPSHDPAFWATVIKAPDAYR